TPEQVIHFFAHIAQEVREILASLGARSLDEVIGRTDLLRQVKRGFAEADRLNLSPLLERLDADGEPIRNTERWNGYAKTSELNLRLLEAAAAAVERQEAIELELTIGNCDRTAGATLSGAIGGRYGDAGLPEGTITVRFTGSAGQ